MRIIVSRQMDNWKLPYVNLSPNVWRIALWQHTIFTEVMDRTLWSIKCSRLAVFPEKHLCGNKINSLYLEFYPLSPMFLCEQQEAERWIAADTYTVSTRYWLRNVTYHNLNTCENWQWLIENRISRIVWLKTYLRWSHKLRNPKLIFKNCSIKTCFDALVYDLLSFKAISLFLMSAQTGFTRSHNALVSKISSDRTS